jgi:AraC-like DNA-binding protein
MKRNLIEFFRASRTSKSSSLVLYYAGREKCLPSHQFGPAMRAQYLLHFILSGRGEFCIRDKTYSLTKNQAFIIKPGESTYYIADTEDPWEYMWFAFDGSEVVNILQDCGLMGETPITSYVLDDQLITAFSGIITQLENRIGNEYTLLGNLYHIFGHLSHSHNTSDTEYSNIYLQQAINFIRNNYRNNIKVQDVANYCQVERSYLYRIFMAELYTSPKQYLIQYRLRSAIDLITNSDLNTTEISYACGFSGPSIFCKYFRNHTGFTPKRYRTIDGDKTLSFVPASTEYLPTKTEG